VDAKKSTGTMKERAGTKKFSSAPSFFFKWIDFGVGERFGCGLGEGSDSHGVLVHTIQFVLH
jgi:hypothetical protein